jgi:hypothetical protein
MATAPRRLRFPHRFEIRLTAGGRRRLVRAALLRLLLGALGLLALCAALA